VAVTQVSVEHSALFVQHSPDEQDTPHAVLAAFFVCAPAVHVPKSAPQNVHTPASHACVVAPVHG
jgi:hypothetical protein